MTKYHLESGGPSGDQLPILKHCWIAWRSTSGQPEFRGIYPTESDARADPASGKGGWRIDRVPLVAFNAIVLKGGAG